MAIYLLFTPCSIDTFTVKRLQPNPELPSSWRSSIGYSCFLQDLWQQPRSPQKKRIFVFSFSQVKARPQQCHYSSLCHLFCWWGLKQPHVMGQSPTQGSGCGGKCFHQSHPPGLLLLFPCPISPLPTSPHSEGVPLECQPFALAVLRPCAT